MDVKLRATIDFTTKVNVDPKSDKDEWKLTQLRNFINACVKSPRTLFDFYLYRLSYTVYVDTQNFPDLYDVYKSRFGSHSDIHKMYTMPHVLNDLDPNENKYIFDVVKKLSSGKMDFDNPDAELIYDCFHSKQVSNIRMEMLQPYQLHTDFPIELKPEED